MADPTVSNSDPAAAKANANASTTTTKTTNSPVTVTSTQAPAATAAPNTPTTQQEVPVSTVTNRDGSITQTFADGSTLITDASGQYQTYNSASASTYGQTAVSDPSNSSSPSFSPAVLKSKETAPSPISDWRVKLSLKSGTNYLYNAAGTNDLLYPLKLTGGIVFPYTPTIQTAYRANYDPAELTHSNYKMYFYRNSNVDEVQITCDFTAQDNNEATYMLAVIHFLKSATKMFYGKDTEPRAGTPPPLVYLDGYGEFQFNKHPMLISSFNYTLPNDVDYIRATSATKTQLGTTVGVQGNASFSPGLDFVATRLLHANLNSGGKSSEPVFNIVSTGYSTYVPTKIQLSITCLPVVSRDNVSNQFSLKDYATGSLLRGSQRNSGGFW